VLSRRALLRLTLAAPLLAACDVRPPYGIPVPTPTGTNRERVLLWHGDAVLGERVFARELTPRLQGGGVEVEALAHGDPGELLRRVQNAAAGGVGPDVWQLPGEWLPDAVTLKLVQPLPAELAAWDPAAWTPKLLESASWQGQGYGVPAAPRVRQPYYNDELLRNAGLIDAGRTTPPTTWAEFADVSKRVSAPEDRWGSQLPSTRADELLFRHVVQHAWTAGAELPKREGTRVAFDTPPVRDALQYLLDLVQRNGAEPLDKPPFRLAETGKVGLWWSETTWLGDMDAIGNTLRVGAAPVPRKARGGALVQARHWVLGAYAAQRDAAVAVLGGLAADELSNRYCAGLSLPPARRANWTAPAYTRPTVANGARVWPAALAQLDAADNAALTGFVGYRATAARMAGELLLVLTGKKPIQNALVEGEAAVADLMRKIDDGGRP